MSDTVIKVENLSKRYVIGHQRQERYSTLRDAIANGARSLKQRFFNPSQNFEDPTHEEFWALKDVSFEIKQGDRVGIIGRNGAGKSTLLKILSRITEPTSGKISIKGRVASLLEVGTGFHQELTGRENIFLNGAILGMSRAEIKKKFDEIVDFAEVERFLDTPVKHYSSGMYVRLAFAVAAHLEPEILIVDEVLAVGDAAFQKKCLGKMEDVAEKEGRTILFVSHQMGAIQSLCNSVILLDKGNLKSVGDSSQIINQYCELYINEKRKIFKPKKNLLSYIQDIEIGSCNKFKSQFTTDEFIDFYINIFMDNINNTTDLLFFIHSRKYGGRISLIEQNLKNIKSDKNEICLTIKIPPNFLMPGFYSCEVGILDNVTEYLDHHSNVAAFDVIQGSNPFIKYGDRDLGIIFSTNHQLSVKQ